jgi:hypothetical protein
MKSAERGIVCRDDSGGSDTTASPQQIFTHPAIERILQSLTDSSLVEHSWKDGGKATIGYLEERALSDVCVHCKYIVPARTAGDPSPEYDILFGKEGI